MNVKRLYQSIRYITFSNFPFVPKLFYRFVYRPSKKRISGRLHAFSQSQNHILNFIQIGANDGVSNDPIYKLLSAYQWTGIRIEPQPLVYSQLKKLHQYTGNVITHNAAIGSSSGTTTMYKVAFSNKRWAHGLTTMDKKSLENDYENGNIKKWAEKNGESLPLNSEVLIEEISVNLTSVEDLMAFAPFKSIDLLVIDAEGYDWELMKMFFEKQLIPKALLFEHINFDHDTTTKCHKMLKDFGFELQQYGANTFAQIAKGNS